MRHDLPPLSKLGLVARGTLPRGVGQNPLCLIPDVESGGTRCQVEGKPVECYVAGCQSEAQPPPLRLGDPTNDLPLAQPQVAVCEPHRARIIAEEPWFAERGARGQTVILMGDDLVERRLLLVARMGRQTFTHLGGALEQPVKIDLSGTIIGTDGEVGEAELILYEPTLKALIQMLSALLPKDG